MEISLENDFPENEGLLSQEQRPYFYRKMRRVVVMVRFAKNLPASEGEDEDKDEETVSFGEGSGFIISRDGHILTCSHVIEDCTDIVVGRTADELKEAVVFYDDKLSDVAILKVKDMDMQYDFCKFGRVENLHIGMDVFTIMPCPTKLEFTFTQGYVGFPNRSYRDVVTGTDCRKCDDNLPLIQIHGLNNLSGSSGSPIFDSMGRVIGMFILSNRGIDFAVHIRKLREICQSVIPTSGSGSGSSSSNTTHVEKKKRKRKKAGPSH
ncbi:unnamed protein product [Camellia sinensis]